jgi:hypothetical protein
VADELGTAVLRIVADDSAARESLNVLRRDVEQLTTRATRASRGAGGSGDTAPGGITRQDVRRFNLRGLNAALESVNQDITAIRTGRRINIGSSWNKALGELAQVNEDITAIRVGRQLNISSSWNKALGELTQVNKDITAVRTGRRLNIGSNWNKALGQLAQVDTDLRSVASAKALNIRTSWGKFLEQLKETKRDIDAAARQPPSARGLSPAEAEARRAAQAAARRNRDIASNALIGGAFPLLFGQGLGASVGGAAGGAAGGAIGGQFGFGLSLVGTAVGSQFDAIIEKATVLGRALEDPIRNFSAVQESALLSSRGLERQVESLIAVGRQAEAAALIQADLAKAYGGAEAARRLADEQDNLSRSWTLLSVNLGQIALPSIAAAVGDTAEALKGFVALLQLIKGLVPDIPLPQGGQTGSAFFNPLSGGFGAATAIESGKILGRLFGGDDPAKSAKEVAAATQAAVNAEQQRRELLSAQLGAITAQVQGYERLGVERELEVSLLKQAIDLDNLRARGAKQPELDARAQEGNLERFRLQERLNQLVRQEQVIQASRGPILQSQLRLIDQQARGLERQALITQRDLIRREAAKQTGLRPGERGQIEDAALVDTARINAQILALDRERLATSQQQAAQFSISTGALDRQLAAAQRLSQIRTPGGVSILRENATLIEGLLESVSATVDRQLEIESRIQAAQIRGGEQGGLDITQLAREQVVAATETRNALFEAASRLTDAGRKLRDDLRSAVLEFTSVRSDPQGLNRFLSPQAQGRRAQQDFERLLPRFREAQGRFFQLTGERAREFSGPTSGVNEALRDFINTVDREFNATETLNQTTTALNDTNNALVTANLRLAEVTAALAAKDWNVVVNVQGGDFNLQGDANNRALS